jgi:hypothetical protein
MARRLPGRNRREASMSYLFFGALSAAGTVGFAAGLLSFKVKSRWCPVHGVVKRCPMCSGSALSNRTAA